MTSSSRIGGCLKLYRPEIVETWQIKEKVCGDRPIYFTHDPQPDGSLGFIKTFHGFHRVFDTDWIVRYNDNLVTVYTDENFKITFGENNFVKLPT
jgi:hypothetical protein